MFVALYIILSLLLASMLVALITACLRENWFNMILAGLRINCVNH